MAFFIGILIASLFYFNYLRKPPENSFIPSFKLRNESIGKDRNVNREPIEPSFTTRYINVLEADGGRIINLSRQRKENAVEVFECKDQDSADTTIALLLTTFSGSVADHDARPLYINITNEDQIINITISNDRDDNAIEVVKCMDERECKDLIRKVETHYEKYRPVLVFK
ncbi:hypothetical protein [Virgibacillus litoralis]|uniref:Uncharacterized protein n=1 Tax=Virgibacillus litoralis TaxID=578221 RepID=A0ABS4H8C0_9BACI|nr:hypothetical protein [Virgibacillus litoralis]MBP1947154.1 hypothetical protein [Virgibacillus litoralis]